MTQQSGLLPQISGFANGIRNRALTYGQVYLPVVAGKLVKSITSKSSSGTSGEHAGAAVDAAGAAPEQPAGRYQPAGNDRTDGIVAAQASAAPLPREIPPAKFAAEVPTESA